MPVLLKHLGIKTIMAFLFGIGGLCLVFYLCMFTNAGDDKTPFIIGMFVGYPTGAAIGIYITRKLFLKLTRNNTRCLIISLVFAYIGIGGTILSILIFNIDNNVVELFYFFIVIIFSLLGDSLAAKLSDRSTQTH